MANEIFYRPPGQHYATDEIPLRLDIYKADTGEWVGPLHEYDKIRVEWCDRGVASATIEVPWNEYSKKLIACDYSHVLIARMNGRRQAFFPVISDLESDEVHGGTPWVKVELFNAWDALTGMIYDHTGTTYPQKDTNTYSGSLFDYLINIFFVNAIRSTGPSFGISWLIEKSSKEKYDTHVSFSGDYDNAAEAIEDALYASNLRLEFVPLLPGESLWEAARDYVDQSEWAGRVMADGFAILPILVPYHDVRKINEATRNLDDVMQADAVLTNTWRLKTTRQTATTALVENKDARPEDAGEDYEDTYSYTTVKSKIQPKTHWGRRGIFTEFPDELVNQGFPISTNTWGAAQLGRHNETQDLEAETPPQWHRIFGHMSLVGDSFYDIGSSRDIDLGGRFWAPMVCSMVAVEISPGTGMTVIPTYSLPDLWHATNINAI